jgi:hypothetical protein
LGLPVSAGHWWWSARISYSWNIDKTKKNDNCGMCIRASSVTFWSRRAVNKSISEAR